MKIVIDLPAESDLAPGTVIHTFGYPEPEIFGFLYVLPEHVATVGIFVPSWFRSPMRTVYRYLQHYMLHPYLWRYLKGRASCGAGAPNRCRNRASAASRFWWAMATRGSAKVRAAPTC